MARRKIRDEHDAQSSLTAQLSSGLPLAAWCRQAGIDGRSLNMWRLQLARRQVPPRLSLVEWLPAPPTANAIRDRAAAAEVPCYRIVRGDFTIEVPANFDGDTLCRLLRVVAVC